MDINGLAKHFDNFVNPQHLDVTDFLTSLVISFVLGGAISFIHWYFSDRTTSKRTPSELKGRVSAMFPLMAPAVSTMFWLIRFSPALALGLLGALSFVRFRVPIKRSEDIAFILVLMASSLACSLQLYVGALGIIFISVVYGLIKSRIAPNLPTEEMFLTLRIQSPGSQEISAVVSKIEQTLGRMTTVKSEFGQEGYSSFVFKGPLLSLANQQVLASSLKTIEPLASVGFETLKEKD